ncbi:hypothetical protein IFM89_022043 [Coptis chinensis]|uniref:Uncharacterized protein n=1 Tax=Coptis chinensis TaxID=261450 RepID=A0A835LW17_9MAGN|nr:hypothetical protein IFM89_022043 [Coptis chinensis]
MAPVSSSVSIDVQTTKQRCFRTRKKLAIKSTQKLCAVMLDTVGPELQVVNKTEQSISFEADAFVVLTPNQKIKKPLQSYCRSISMGCQSS